MKKTEKFDLVIVGGGPAGSTAAHWAARFGLKTCILDKAEFPRDKICGDWIPPMGLELLEELGLDARKLNVSGCYEDSHLFDFTGEHFQFSVPHENPMGYHNLIARIDFDQHLWESIPSAVIKYPGCEIREMEYGTMRGKHRLSVIYSGNKYVIESTFVVAADGANSWVRKKSGHFDDFKMEFARASRGYAVGVSGTESCLAEYQYPDSLIYNWKFPLGGNKKNCGVYIPSGSSLDKGKLAFMLQSSYYGDDKLDVQTFKGAPIPTFAGAAYFAKKGIFLTGDAAGFSDPLCGHGIELAMFTGKISVQCIRKASGNKWRNSKRSASRYYNEFIRREICPQFENMRKFRDDFAKDRSSLIEVMIKNAIKNTNIE